MSAWRTAAGLPADSCVQPRVHCTDGTTELGATFIGNGALRRRISSGGSLESDGGLQRTGERNQRGLLAIHPVTV